MRLVIAVVMLVVAAAAWDQGEGKTKPDLNREPVVDEKHRDFDAELAVLTHQIDALAQRIDTTVRMFADANTDQHRADTKAELLKLEAQHAELTARLAELQAARAKSL